MSTVTFSGTFIDERRISEAIERHSAPSKEAVAEALSRGRKLKGLSLEDAAVLVNARGEEARKAIFETAESIKETIYGDRLVFFAPLYLSNYCVNDCGYCGFHAGNRSGRKKLTMDEIRSEVCRLIEMGHKRLLLEAGEDPANNPIEYVLEAIDTIYSVKTPKGEIRRLNVNIAATTVENYRQLKEKGIGTYQLFQETYHRETFDRLHRGPKADYTRQLYAMDKAFEAGIDDVGLGVLFGLYDWRFEVLALVSHAEYLSAAFGVGPHTISVPRFRPAPSVGFAPSYPVSDGDFLKLIAVLRIAVPYTGMIITTRESPEIRETAFRIGISQTSAASTTTPGGFAIRENGGRGVEQFTLSDKRTLDEIAISVMKQGYTPSFCTACYRKNRTGSVFMDLAKPGDIHEFCAPNSILTLLEYLEDIASPESRALGMEIIKKSLDGIENPAIREATEEKIERIKKGERDLYF
ncbi:MAG TPA: [FeFe] hydrogenase H-cluster radical SAM maturase HydG [Thermodesulfobacteriota bacterium]|nr:[FeFe] hydrogenase H-cluster radical SAM maturase HydG [Thermodesulfobacteriota bacterium]